MIFYLTPQLIEAYIAGILLRRIVLLARSVFLVDPAMGGGAGMYMAGIFAIPIALVALHDPILQGAKSAAPVPDTRFATWAALLSVAIVAAGLI